MIFTLYFLISALQSRSAEINTILVLIFALLLWNAEIKKRSVEITSLKKLLGWVDTLPFGRLIEIFKNGDSPLKANFPNTHDFLTLFSK